MELPQGKKKNLLAILNAIKGNLTNQHTLCSMWKKVECVQQILIPPAHRQIVKSVCYCFSVKEVKLYSMNDKKQNVSLNRLAKNKLVV